MICTTGIGNYHALEIPRGTGQGQGVRFWQKWDAVTTGLRSLLRSNDDQRCIYQSISCIYCSSINKQTTRSLHHIPYTTITKNFTIVAELSIGQWPKSAIIVHISMTKISIESVPHREIWRHCAMICPEFTIPARNNKHVGTSSGTWINEDKHQPPMMTFGQPPTTKLFRGASMNKLGGFWIQPLRVLAAWIAPELGSFWRSKRIELMTMENPKNQSDVPWIGHLPLPTSQAIHVEGTCYSTLWVGWMPGSGRSLWSTCSTKIWCSIIGAAWSPEHCRKAPQLGVRTMAESSSWLLFFTGGDRLLPMIDHGWFIPMCLGIIQSFLVC